MKYSKCAVVVFCVIVMVSCREKPASTRPSVATPQLNLPTGSPANASPNTVLPGSNPVVGGSGSAAVNPAHGQPGHRCDIAVGAPLPGASQTASPAIPTSTASSTPSIQPVSLPAAGTATPAAAATGLNPEHGKPGHRCDIAVGAPLSSAPATNSTNAKAPAAPAELKPTPLAPDTLLAKGLNPAHGQPGHRCDVAVGKPLSEAKNASN